MRYNAEGMRRLQVAILRQAVQDARGKGHVPAGYDAQTNRARRLALREPALRWLAGHGPTWFRVLGIPLPETRFHDWIDGQAEAWERLSA